MIDYHKTMVEALNTVLPAHYEMTLTSGTATPCISYMEINNYVHTRADKLEYSSISYQIKVWAHDIAVIQQYAIEIDRVLRPLGWTRVSAGELHDPQSTMIQKIMTYEALASEEFE